MKRSKDLVFFYKYKQKMLRITATQNGLKPVKDSTTRQVEKTQQRVKKLPPRQVLAERLNGRMAMLGTVSGLTNQYITHQDVIQQISDPKIAASVVAASALVGYGTLRTKDVVLNKEQKPFVSTIENLNGRLAMLGFIAMLLSTQY